MRATHQLGALADINTENPVVIKELKDTYKYWMSEVGVDGFRIDTVIYVPFDFWHRFAHDDDGIYAHARELGKEHFISFGETFLLSDPFDDAGEQEISGFFETDGRPGLNSMLGFPLFQEINRVLAQARPPSQLEKRADSRCWSVNESPRRTRSSSSRTPRTWRVGGKARRSRRTRARPSRTLVH